MSSLERQGSQVLVRETGEVLDVSVPADAMVLKWMALAFMAELRGIAAACDDTLRTAMAEQGTSLLSDGDYEATLGPGTPDYTDVSGLLRELVDAGMSTDAARSFAVTELTRDGKAELKKLALRHDAYRQVIDRHVTRGRGAVKVHRRAPVLPPPTPDPGRMDG